MTRGPQEQDEMEFVPDKPVYIVALEGAKPPPFEGPVFLYTQNIQQLVKTVYTLDALAFWLHYTRIKQGREGMDWVVLNPPPEFMETIEGKGFQAPMVGLKGHTMRLLNENERSELAKFLEDGEIIQKAENKRTDDEIRFEERDIGEGLV